MFGDKDSIAERLAASPGKVIKTSYIERSNLSWRPWDAHLHKKTLTFAKSLRWLDAKLAICIVWHNFVREHNSLTQPLSDCAQKLTPAMAAGITDQPWNLDEFLNLSLFVN